MRCKFRVFERKQSDYGVTISAAPVYSTDPASENKQFWDATPIGQFSVTIPYSNASVLDGFDVGVEFYIDAAVPAVEATPPSPPVAVPAVDAPAESLRGPGDDDGSGSA